MILDTTVLIDLQKELRREQPGAASRLLERSGQNPVFITFVSRMEFAEGFEEEARPAFERFLSGFRALWPDDETAWLSARISRSLRAAGGPIGDHDLWIAALAIQHGHRLFSRNERHFSRVSGLTLSTY